MVPIQLKISHGINNGAHGSHDCILNGGKKKNPYTSRFELEYLTTPQANRAVSIAHKQQMKSDWEIAWKTLDGSGHYGNATGRVGGAG